MWQHAIVKHHRVKLVAVFKTAHLAEELSTAFGCKIESVGKRERFYALVKESPPKF